MVPITYYHTIAVIQKHPSVDVVDSTRKGCIIQANDSGTVIVHYSAQIVSCTAASRLKQHVAVSLIHVAQSVSVIQNLISPFVYFFKPITVKVQEMNMNPLSFSFLKTYCNSSQKTAALGTHGSKKSFRKMKREINLRTKQKAVRNTNGKRNNNLRKRERDLRR